VVSCAALVPQLASRLSPIFHASLYSVKDSNKVLPFYFVGWHLRNLFFQTKDSQLSQRPLCDSRSDPKAPKKKNTIYKRFVRKTLVRAGGVVRRADATQLALPSFTHPFFRYLIKGTWPLFYKLSPICDSRSLSDEASAVESGCNAQKYIPHKSSVSSVERLCSVISSESDWVLWGLARLKEMIAKVHYFRR